jgi:nitrogen fixation protein FixH
MSRNKQDTSAWRHFPLIALLSLGGVIAVNGVLAYDALSTFPGLAVRDDFDASNRYDEVLDKAQRQAALGWSVQTRAEAGRAVVVLIARDGTAIDAAQVTATAQRPLGPPRTTALRLVAEGDGIYRADAPLDALGQWDLALHVVVGGDTLSATRRVIVR